MTPKDQAQDLRDYARDLRSTIIKNDHWQSSPESLQAIAQIETAAALNEIAYSIQLFANKWSCR
jgi:hypothetical protein